MDSRHGQVRQGPAWQGMAMKSGFLCMFFGHKWQSYRPVNAKYGDEAWTCKRCHKVEYSR